MEHSVYKNKPRQTEIGLLVELVSLALTPALYSEQYE